MTEKTINKFSFNTNKVGLLMIFLQTITQHFDFNKKFRAVVDYDPKQPATKVEVSYDNDEFKS